MMNKALIAQVRDALEAYKATSPLGAETGLRCLNALIEDEKCNGWSNWETWNVKLWLDNEQGTYEAARDLVRDNPALDSGSAAEALKDYCEELCFGDEAPASMATDLTRGALSAVNWQEIARAYAEEIAEG